MNAKSLKVMLCLAIILIVASFSEAHKKYYSGPQYQEPQHERCVCDCAVPNRQPVLPNRPYYGSSGYAQPRPSGGGYGNAGSYAVSGSYGSGGSQVSGGY